MKINIKVFTMIISALFFIGISGCDDDGVEPDEDQMAFDAANEDNGGRLYDKFWASETDFVAPSDPSVDLADITNFSDFYRCKQCHAWDFLGNAASYIDRGPTMTRPDVSSANLYSSIQSSSIRELFDGIKNVGGAAVDPARTADGTNPSLGGNEHPEYGKILTDDQIWDLVRFLKISSFNTTLLYDINVTGTYPTGSRTFSNVGKDGDAAAGAIFYATNCASCHGANGRDDGGDPLQINVDIGRSMGEFAREKPYEMQHKTRFGNLGSSPEMLGTGDVPLEEIKNMFKALADPVNYPDL
jgi:hypothetical protein